MKTIQDKKETSSSITIPYPSNLYEEDQLTFEIKGLTNERSYEDRDVFLNIKSGDNSIITSWIRGEDAIDLGMKLIEHGKFALESNMINHQSIHMTRQFKLYLDEDRIEEVEFIMIDPSPVNYGDGFKTFLIKPHWVEGMAPKYDENFELKTVIYWSPFTPEYLDMLDYYTNGCSYSFVGYNHDDEVKRFNEQVRLMSGD